MPRLRPLLLALSLIALTLLAPTLAAAFPEGVSIRSAAERPENPGIFTKLWEFLSAVWTTGPGLDPDGANAPSGFGTEPNPDTGDTGSGLDPDG